MTSDDLSRDIVVQPDLSTLIVLPGGATFKKEKSEEELVKEQLANFKAPAKQSWFCREATAQHP